MRSGAMIAVLGVLLKKCWFRFQYKFLFRVGFRV